MAGHFYNSIRVKRS